MAIRRCGRRRSRFFLPVAEMFLATRALQHGQKGRHPLLECIATTRRRRSLPSLVHGSLALCVETAKSEVRNGSTSAKQLAACKAWSPALESYTYTY